MTCGLCNDLKNLVNFHTSSRKFENLNFDGLLLSKPYNILDEKVQKSYVSWHWRVAQSLKKNLVPKMTWGIWWILMRAVASLKMCILMCYFCQKLFCLSQKSTEEMCHNTEEWCKIWKRTDLCFEKWYEEFGEFWSNTRKSQNLLFNGLVLTKVYNV